MLGIRHVIKCSQQTGRLLAGRKICKNTVQNRELKTSIICCNILDARDKETIRREEQVAIRKAKIFDEVAQNERNKENFQRAVHKFNTRHDRYRRGNVEFMYAAMERMKVPMQINCKLVPLLCGPTRELKKWPHQRGGRW